MFQNVPVTSEIEFHGQNLKLETGSLAQQATASVLATLGETSVLAVVVVGKAKDSDYFPLQVIYEERMYASGKIKGSRFIKREGRPSDNAVLTGRMIDRSLRSLFNDNIRNEIQVIVTVLSLDEVNTPDALSVLAASSALGLCGLITDNEQAIAQNLNAFAGQVSCVRVSLGQNSLGDFYLQKLSALLQNPSLTYEEVQKLFNSINQTLKLDSEENKNWLTQLYSSLGKKNPQWAVKLKEEYKKTPKLERQDLAEFLKTTYPDYSLAVIVNPSYKQINEAKIDLVVSGNGQNVVMVEAGANIVDEESFNICLDKANLELEFLTKFQMEFIQKAKEMNFAKESNLSFNLPDTAYSKYWQDFSLELESILYSDLSKEEKAKNLQEFKKQHFDMLENLKS